MYINNMFLSSTIYAFLNDIREINNKSLHCILNEKLVQVEVNGIGVNVSQCFNCESKT